MDAHADKRNHADNANALHACVRSRGVCSGARCARVRVLPHRQVPASGVAMRAVAAYKPGVLARPRPAALPGRRASASRLLWLSRGGRGGAANIAAIAASSLPSKHSPNRAPNSRSPNAKKRSDAECHVSRANAARCSANERQNEAK